MQQNAPENIRDHPIAEEMKTSYLNFALSVIMSRALPDVRDGLKPVQRRILVAANDLNLAPRAQQRKCALIVGDTMGKYHPHGDQAIYHALVRMGQDFNFRYPLIDAQGNFGSIDGDPPAAMRYTEARMTQIAAEMLNDINMETVDFRPNYDETRDEPVVLPARFPNLLCNGTSGIAVGMATSIPPHNLNEVCDATIKLIDNPDTPIEDLMKIVKGPDFPGGGMICGRSGIRKAYKTGRGSVTMRALAHVESGKREKKSLVFTQMPYMVSPDRVAEQIADRVKNEKLDGIADVRNESDQDGLRLVVDLKKGEDEQVVLNQLYKNTQLQERHSIMSIAIVNGRPQTLTLKNFLESYIEHRVEVIQRRTRYLLRKAEERAHVLEGLLIALDHLDEVIKTIRASKDAAEAEVNLIKKFKLSEIQAKAILAMRLSQLTSLERDKVIKEHKELMEKIEYYRAILGDRGLVLDIIREDLYELKEKYGDERRTQIVGEVDNFDIEDLIADEMVAVVISHDGYIKRQPVDTYRKQRRGGKGITATGTKDGDFVEHLFIAATLDYIMFFSDKGQVYWLKVYDIPEMGRSARGRAIVNLLEMGSGESIAATIPVRSFDEGYLLMATEKGTIKKTELSAYGNPKKGGIIAINLKKGDSLVDVSLCQKEMDVILATSKGKAIRFKDSDARPMGRATAGVRGIKLAKGDSVVGMVVGDPDATLLSICENGYGKRTQIEDYRLQSRGGGGVINIRTTERNGQVVDVLLVTDQDEVMMVTEHGMMIRTTMENVRTMGRATQGVRLINVKSEDKVVAMTRVQDTTERTETGQIEMGVQPLDDDDDVDDDIDDSDDEGSIPNRDDDGDDKGEAEDE